MKHRIRFARELAKRQIMTYLEQAQDAVTKLSENEFRAFWNWIIEWEFEQSCKKLGIAGKTGVFDRMTDRSRRVIQLAVQEAMAANHKQIGPEHLLLGMSREGAGVAAHILKEFDASYSKMQFEFQRLVPPQPEQTEYSLWPLSAEALNLLEDSHEEARKLGHHYVGTEHLLLSIANSANSVASAMLTALGVKQEDIRREVLQLLGYGD